MKIEQRLTILVLEDYEANRRSNIEKLQEKYPDAKIVSAVNVEDTLTQVEQYQPNLLIADLAVPKNARDTAKATASNGVNLLKHLMQHQNNLSIVVLSTFPERIIELKYELEQYEGGGFTVATKTDEAELLKKAEWALEGIIYTKEVPGMRSGDFKPEWIKLLQLACQEGCLEDEPISAQMHVSKRTVRNYWEHIYDLLEIDREQKNGVNLRALTAKKARELGLID